MAKTPLKTITDAARADILALLDRDKVHIYEFRRISGIAAAMDRFCGGYGTPHEHSSIETALRYFETQGPETYKALTEIAFDGDKTLKAKYKEVSNFHTELQTHALDLKSAEMKLASEKRKLESRAVEVQSHEERLREHEQLLENEHERLRLIAARSGTEVRELPALPRLIPLDEEAEATETKEED